MFKHAIKMHVLCYWLANGDIMVTYWESLTPHNGPCHETNVNVLLEDYKVHVVCV